MFETNANVESEWRVALFCCCLEKNVSKKTLLVLPDVVFCASFAFFTRFVFSLFALFYTACGCLKKMHLRRRVSSTFLLSLTKHHQKMPNPKKIFSQRSPHNLASHHHHHHRDIKRTREELFRAFQRERV